MPQGSLDSSHILGAVVMLYHPCAPEELVEELRRIVVGCLRKQYFLYISFHCSWNNYLKILVLILFTQKAYNRPERKIHQQGKTTNTCGMALQVLL